jgi:hypothetical protein
MIDHHRCSEVVLIGGKSFLLIVRVMYRNLADFSIINFVWEPLKAAQFSEQIYGSMVVI